MAPPQMMALDQALTEVEVPHPEPRRWAGQLADLARQLPAMLGRHRDIVPCSIGLLPGGGGALRCHERAPAIMRTGGLPDSQAATGPYLLWIIVNGFSPEETQTEGLQRPGPELAPVVSYYFASLPGNRFPKLAAVAGEFIASAIDGLTARAGQP